MNGRKILAILVTVVMVFGSFAVSFADDTAAATATASNTTFTDIMATGAQPPSKNGQVTELSADLKDYSGRMIQLQEVKWQ
jgi:hypothetical protein